MFGLLTAIVLLAICIFAIVKAINVMNCPADKFKFHFKVFWVDGNINHNNINKLQKGECEFKLDSGMFYFKQNDNIVSDNIFDIQNIRTWNYEGFKYIAIDMKTHSEYMFSLLIDNDSVKDVKMLNALSDGMLNQFRTLAKKLQIEFVESSD